MKNLTITPKLLKQAKQAVNSAKYSATAERKKEAVDVLMKLAVAVQNLEEIKTAPKEQLKPKAKKTKASKKKAVHDNGRLAKKTRVRRTSNERLDDHATKQSLERLFDNAMALRY